MSSCCPICADDFDLQRPGKVLTCCNAVICQNCLYAHIQSILGEGITGDGRKELLCPFACGATILDSTVRECFQMKHVRLLRYIVGRSIFHIFCYMGHFHSFFLDKAVLFWRLAQSVEERQDLSLYARWSLSVALSNMSSLRDNPKRSKSRTKQKKDAVESSPMDASHVYTHVMRCPRPNCECLWLVNASYRRCKLDNEKPTEIRKKLLLSCSTFFFTPIPAEKEESIMNENGYTTEHWLNPMDIDVFEERNFQKNKRRRSLYAEENNRIDGHNDGRQVTCPGCKHQFCGLCSRPWNTMSKSSGIRVSHSRQPCSVYGQRALEDDDFLLSAEAGDARCCPGCSMRTNRTFGCNHMSCPCGYHWCYICECRFDPRHYRCEEGNGIGRDVAASCILS